MSSPPVTPPMPPYPPPWPPATPRKRPRRAPSPKAAGPKLPKWGWLEMIVASQTFLPALLFVPGMSSVRTINRVSAFAIGLVVWAAVLLWGTRSKLVSTFPARPWLLCSAAWLVLSIAHPNSYSLPASLAHAMLYVSILSPAFWAGELLIAPKQLARVMAVLFLCNGASAAVGVAQAYYPSRFLPPEIPALKNTFGGSDLTYETDDGRKILRPCGLTDTPGSAAPAGATAALIGLCMMLRPIGLFRRAACAGVAFLGVAAIYYTQVRSPLVMLVVCFVMLTALFLAQRRVGMALGLIMWGTGMVVGALAWVARSVGGRVIDRFATLLSSDPGHLYYQSRGGYVAHAFGTVIWQNPLGYGLGWWGIIHGIFAKAGRPTTIWVEVMLPAWIYDGGFPLLIAYGGAVIVALYDSIRIALTSRDREVSFWAVVIVAQNMSLAATCFSYVTFLSPLGFQFWLLAAMLHAADQQARAAGHGDGARKRRRPAFIPPSGMAPGALPT